MAVSPSALAQISKKEEAEILKWESAFDRLLEKTSSDTYTLVFDPGVGNRIVLSVAELYKAAGWRVSVDTNSAEPALTLTNAGATVQPATAAKTWADSIIAAREAAAARLRG